MRWDVFGQYSVWKELAIGIVFTSGSLVAVCLVALLEIKVAAFVKNPDRSWITKVDVLGMPHPPLVWWKHPVFVVFGRRIWKKRVPYVNYPLSFQPFALEL